MAADEIVELVAFIRDRLDEAEEIVNRDDVPVRSTAKSTGNPECIVYDKDRLRRAVDAKRRIVELHEGAHNCRDLVTGNYSAEWPAAATWGSPGVPWRHGTDEYFEENCLTLKLLASEWSDHPDYRKEWTP